MAFPTNPTNGDQTTQNGIVYIYNATLGVWAVLTNTAGNISAGNIVVTNSVASGTVSAVGNITGEYFVGNGSQLTGISAGGGGDGGVANSGVFLNAQTITANVDISNVYNAFSVGPLTLAANAVVTQAAGSKWVIL
jgi:hypothetical protein